MVKERRRKKGESAPVRGRLIPAGALMSAVAVKMSSWNDHQPACTGRPPTHRLL